MRRKFDPASANGIDWHAPYVYAHEPKFREFGGEENKDVKNVATCALPHPNVDMTCMYELNSYVRNERAHVLILFSSNDGFHGCYRCCCCRCPFHPRRPQGRRGSIGLGGGPRQRRRQPRVSSVAAAVPLHAVWPTAACPSSDASSHRIAH